MGDQSGTGRQGPECPSSVERRRPGGDLVLGTLYLVLGSGQKYVRSMIMIKILMCLIYEHIQYTFVICVMICMMYTGISRIVG